MSRTEAALIIFLLLFIIVFIFDYFIVNKKYLKRLNGKIKKKKKNNELTEISYLVGKFNLDKSKININRLLIVIALINAFIISIVSVSVMLIKINIILQLLIGFILLISLIYSLYEILGRILVKKGYGKNEF